MHSTSKGAQISEEAEEARVEREVLSVQHRQEVLPLVMMRARLLNTESLAEAAVRTQAVVAATAPRHSAVEPRHCKLAVASAP